VENVLLSVTHWLTDRSRQFSCFSFLRSVS